MHVCITTEGIGIFTTVEKDKLYDLLAGTIAYVEGDRTCGQSFTFSRGNYSMSKITFTVNEDLC